MKHQRSQQRRRAQRRPTTQTQNLRRNQSRPARPFSRQPRRPRFTRKTIVSFFGTIVVILLLAWSLAFGVLETKITYSGSNEQQIQAIADTYFAQTSRLRFTFDEASFQRYIESQAPFLETVSVTLPLLSRQVSVYTEEQPVGIVWQSGGKQYVLSRSGFVLRTTDDADTRLPLVFDGSDLTYEPGQKLVPERFVDFVLRLARILKEQGSEYDVVALSVGQSSRSVVLTMEDYEIRLSTRLTPDSQLATANDLLAKLVQEGRAFPGEYIDTRIAGRVFWR